MDSDKATLWAKTAATSAYPLLRGSMTADVVVVGAGITGMTAAALLTQAGKKVIVIDGGHVASGVTSGTTAHITTVLDTRFHQIAADFGADGARLAAQSHQDAISQIAALTSMYGLNNDFERVPAYLYTEDEKETSTLDDELIAMQEAGLPATMAENFPLSFPVQRAIQIADQAQFHPLKHVYGLAQRLSEEGVQIFEHSRVKKIQDSDGSVYVDTPQGTITAGAVFMATHIPPGINVVDTQVAPYRSYVMAFHPRQDYPPGLFWDMDNPYNYTRLYQHDGETWLIVGGRDHKTGTETDTDSRYRELEGYARTHFAMEDGDAAFQWSAQVYEPVDGLAYIGKSPGAHSYYYATGYAGNGITYANVAARLVTDLILERENPYADLYSPSRVKPVASAADFLKENTDVIVHRVADYLRVDAAQFSEVEPHEGRLVKIGTRQIAAYREANGRLHIMSATCPHMGCVVAWNKAEQTWDCPCHGGRFTATGDWIEGPPMHNLEKLERQSVAAD